MIAKTITYTDFNGVERTEKFYFHLSEAELSELELTHPNGFADYINDIVNSKDNKKIVDMFKDIIRMSYGVKSEDGRRFIKSAEVSEEFFQTNAYSKLFMELGSDANAAAEFVNGLLPSELMEAAKNSKEIKEL